MSIWLFNILFLFSQVVYIVISLFILENPFIYCLYKILITGTVVRKAGAPTTGIRNRDPWIEGRENSQYTT